MTFAADLSPLAASLTELNSLVLANFAGLSKAGRQHFMF